MRDVRGQSWTLFVGILLLILFSSESGLASASDEVDGRIGVVNIINFIRAVEPREKVDLVEPVREQIRLIQGKQLEATWLVQYDALLEERFVSLLKGLDERQEVGGWFEVVQPLVEDAGYEWRGRFPWDWHCNVGFSIGYRPEQREKLIDVYMEKFKEVFGEYPEVVGSWFIDAHTLGYLWDKYKIIGSCNCKEQIGTDGYTVWGGFYNHAYYPSRKNMICPGQNAENQIPVPVFRMLGNDPIWAYESFTGRGRGIHSLEAVTRAGSSPEWVKWFFEVNFDAPCLSFGYTQAGQENSFGWPRMKAGFEMQVPFMADEVAAGRVNVWTLGKTARWFKERYKLTPPSAITALSDWRGEGLKSVWYCCKNYRTSLLWDKDKFWIRDIQKFDETYPERYLTEVCTTADCTYDNLPILDGGWWTAGKTTGKIQAVALSDGKAEPLSGLEPEVTEQGGSTLKIRWPLKDGGVLEMLLKEDGIEMVCGRKDWGMEMSWGRDETQMRGVLAKSISYDQRGHKYQAVLSSGRSTRSIRLRDTQCRKRPTGEKKHHAACHPLRECLLDIGLCRAGGRLRTVRSGQAHPLGVG